MAVDTLFDNVRFLVQGGGTTNLATNEPWIASANGVTSGAGFISIDSVSSVLVGVPTSTATELVQTHELVFRPKSYTRFANLFEAGISYVVDAPGEVGCYVRTASGSVRIYEFPIPQTGDVALSVTTVATSSPNTVQITARVIQAGGSAATHTSAVLPIPTSITNLPSLAMVLAPVVLVADPLVTITTTVTQAGAKAGTPTQQGVYFIPQTEGTFTPAGDMIVTAVNRGVTRTFTITSTATTTHADAVAALALGIATQVGGTLQTAVVGGKNTLSIRYTPTAPDDAGWTYTFNVNCPPITAQLFQSAVYATPSGIDQITQYIITNGSAEYPVIGQSSGWDNGSRFPITPAGLADFVAYANGNPTGYTASVTQPFATQFIVTATVSKESWSPSIFCVAQDSIASPAFDRLYAVRSTMADRYATQTFEWPGLTFPVTSIPAAGGGAPDPNTLLLMHFNESSGTTLVDETGRTFTSTNDLATQTGAVGKFGRGLMPTSWMAAAGSSPVNLSGGIFTIEFWVTKTNGGSTGYEVVFAQTTSPDTWANGIVLFIDSTNGLAVAYMDGAPSNSSAAMSLTPGTWIHVALVRQGSGASQTKWYVNGTGSAGFQSSYTYVSTTPTIGNTVGQSYNLGYVGIDELRISDIARYTTNFTPPTAPFDIGGGGGPTADVTLAGYNDIESFTGDGTFNTQANAPDAYFFSAATADDVTSTGDAYTVDGNGLTFTSTRTLASATNTGTFVRGTPQNFDSTVTLDDTTAVSTFYADTPKEWTGSATLEDVTQFGLISLLAPAGFIGASSLDDAASDSTFDVIEPITWRVNAEVAVATLSSNVTQFYLNKSVPTAKLSASLSVPDSFNVNAKVPSASLAAWFGVRLDKTVPSASLQSVGIVPNTLRLGSDLPRVTLAANILNGRSFSLQSNVPPVSMSAWSGWQLKSSVPAASAVGVVVVGGAYRVDATVPMASVSSSAVAENVLRLTAMVPAAMRSGWVAVNKTVPAARMIGSIMPVVAITRLAYSFTLANSAMTRYPSYPFIQVIRIGNAYYGIADDGLYELGGTTDNGTAIPWSFETCMSDFGIAEKKTVVSAYLGGYVPQSMAYTIKAGDLPTGTNAHTTTATAVLRNHRQKFGIGRKSRFFAFGLSATQGRVAIESIEFEMASMSRRV